MTQAEFLELVKLVKKLGGEIELEKEEAEAYLPDISNGDDIRDFYIPKVPRGFYYNPDVFRKLLGIK